MICVMKIHQIHHSKHLKSKPFEIVLVEAAVQQFGETVGSVYFASCHFLPQNSSDRQEAPPKVVIDRETAKDGQMDFHGILPGTVA